MLSFYRNYGCAVRLIQDVSSNFDTCVTSYVWKAGSGDQTLEPKEEGIYEYVDTVRSVYGCDSVITTLKLKVKHKELERRETSATISCGANTYSWNLGYKTKELTDIKNDSKFYDTLRSVSGCDSVITTLTVTKQCKFSVSSTKQVDFSPGNLQYCPAQNKWRFAERQFDRCGNGKQAVVPGGENQTADYGITTVFWNDDGEIKPCNNELVSATYGGWIDLFNWGTGNNPTNLSSNASNYAWSEWGDNEIEGKLATYPAGTWRTLENAEWRYLLDQPRCMINGRKTLGYSFVRLQYGDNATDTVTGIIIYPDDFTWEIAGVGAIHMGFSEVTAIGADFWRTLEEVGCVFLPCSSRRSPSLSISINQFSMAYYWSSSSTSLGSDVANCIQTIPHERTQRVVSVEKNMGCSVRLVQDIE